MPWPNLTVDDLRDAQARLPQMRGHVPVLWPMGVVALLSTAEEIVRLEASGWIEQEKDVSGFEHWYLTPRAEHELRRRGVLPEYRFGGV